MRPMPPTTHPQGGNMSTRHNTSEYRFQVKADTYQELASAARTQCERFYGDLAFTWMFESIDGDHLDTSTANRVTLMQMAATGYVVARLT